MLHAASGSISRLLTYSLRHDSQQPKDAAHRGKLMNSHEAGACYLSAGADCRVT